MTAVVGGKRTLSKAPNQALELKAVDIKAGTPSTLRQVSIGALCRVVANTPHQETTNNQRAGNTGSKATSGVTAHMAGRQKMMTGDGNEMKDL
jgi:hypothetical protein